MIPVFERFEIISATYHADTGKGLNLFAAEKEGSKLN